MPCLFLFERGASLGTKKLDFCVERSSIIIIIIILISKIISFERGASFFFVSIERGAGLNTQSVHWTAPK